METLIMPSWHPNDVAKPSLSPSYSLHSFTNRSRLRRGQPRRSANVLRLATFASFFAIVFLVYICGFRSSRRTLSAAAGRRLAGGEETKSPGGTWPDDTCNLSGSYSPTSLAAGGSFLPFFYTRPPEQSLLEERKRKASEDGSPRSQPKEARTGSPAADLLNPLIEEYISEALASKGEILVADWLLDPERGFPWDAPSDEEQAEAASPGEGTSAATVAANLEMRSRTPGNQDLGPPPVGVRRRRRKLLRLSLFVRG